MKTLPRLLILLALCLSGPLQAAVDVFPFETEAQEARYHHLIDELRCVVCQGQAISESNAPLAQDLRRKVYEQIRAGKSDEEIMAYMVARYSDFVLYRPPFKPATAVLWLGPFLILMAGVTAGYLFVRRRRRVEVAANPERHERARALLKDSHNTP
jgi:cytochrome c-type biogenesis protein CcmH